MNKNKYNFDKETNDLCSQTFPMDIDASIVRKMIKDNVKLLEYDNIINYEFKVPNDIGGTVQVSFYYPEHYIHNSEYKYPILLYIHGGGFVFEGYNHLPIQICNKTNSILVYINYSLSPESKYPVALEQCYHVLLNIYNNNYTDNSNKLNNLNKNNISLIGDSSGGNLSISLLLLLKSRNNISIIQKLLLLYPTLDYSFNNKSYLEYGDGYFLSRDNMIWFWNHYIRDQNDTNSITCCPMKANSTQLSGLPETMIISCEVDVLRDEAEQFAINLLNANVKVSSIRIKNTIHGFLTMPTLSKTTPYLIGLDIIINYLINNNNNIIKIIKDDNNKSLLSLI